MLKNHGGQMNHNEQKLAVFSIVGLVLTILLVAGRFGAGVGLVAVLAVLLMFYVCAKTLL